MKTFEAYKAIIKIENSINTSSFTLDGFNTWPILRMVLWSKLTSNDVNIESQNYIVKTYNLIKGIVSKIFYSYKRVKFKEDSEKIFFSRPVYLQKLDKDKYVDRIVDPVMDLFAASYNLTKYYFTQIPKEKKLVNDYFNFNPHASFRSIKLSQKQRDIIDDIETLLNNESLDLINNYKHDLHKFITWYTSAKRLLKKHNNLKEVYLACWYFPDMMGICAAASELGIKTIDIQHGKQGKYQAMYSGWTKIPEEGYDLMPDSFWCWGQPSCDHILASSPNRKKHIPFIGGYPWVDYYKKNSPSIKLKTNHAKTIVLLTMQAPLASSKERIPEFIIKFLLSKDIEDLEFIFRLHPNDEKGLNYCKERLKVINPSLYSIDDGSVNLYDLMKVATHHITAYSSCCYEASLFNVPTLLYGDESKEIYKEDIDNEVFTWINSNSDDLTNWLYSDTYSKLHTSNPYIDNSHLDTYK